MVHSNHYCTYILSNPGRSAFYTGITNNLTRRLSEHYANRGKSKTFAGKYHCYELVYYESFFYPGEAISREKEIKDLSRDKKLERLTPNYESCCIDSFWELMNVLKGERSDKTKARACAEHPRSFLLKDYPQASV